MNTIERQKKIQEETLYLIKIFLQTNESDIELEKRTGISSSTVGRRLTNKAVILQCFSKDGEKIYELIKEKRRKNLERGKILGGQATLLKNANSKESLKLRSDILYSDREKQIKFLTHLFLTFRVKLPLITELFDVSEKEILNDLIKYNPDIYPSILYLFYQDETDQKLAKERVINYYQNLVNSLIKKDKAGINILLREISDSKIVECKKKINMEKNIIDEDIMTILMYQLKYGLSNYIIGEKFGFDSVNYANRVRNIIKDNIELSERYESLMRYNKEKAESMWK